MFDSEALLRIRQMVSSCTSGDKRLLDDLCVEVRALASSVRAIKPRTATAMALVASDGGNNRLEFDPFCMQLVRVVDSYGKELCLDVVSPTSDTDEISRAQFNDDGSPRTALGRMMLDLGVRPLALSALSPMIPPGQKIRETPDVVSPSWVQVYRDLYEWATLYERICHRSFATNTLIVRDGLLRSKVFSQDLFIRLRRLIEESIVRIYEKERLKVFLVGIAKRSKVLQRYNLAMTIEGVFPPGDPLFVRIPREMEAKAYIWPEYARGSETEGAEGEAPKFVAGDLHFVRFGKHSGDPIWTVDILSCQSSKAPEIFGYLLADAIEGFPVPFYPRCLQKAHEHAQIVDFDLEILRDEVFRSVRDILPENRKVALDCMRLVTDVAERRYQ